MHSEISVWTGVAGDHVDDIDDLIEEAADLRAENIRLHAIASDLRLEIHNLRLALHTPDALDRLIDEVPLAPRRPT